MGRSPPTDRRNHRGQCPNSSSELPLARLFRYLLLVAALLLSLAGHGAATAHGPEMPPAAGSPYAHAMHHGGDIQCDGGHHCPASGRGDWCCTMGHCLSGVLADGVVALPAFRPALPVPADAIAAPAVPQAAPERPPRLA